MISAEYVELPSARNNAHNSHVLHDVETTACVRLTKLIPDKEINVDSAIRLSRAQ